MEGFARQELAQGRGHWWIVDELVRHGHIDAKAAHAMVDRVAPEVYADLIRRRRPFLRIGLLLEIIGLFPLVSGLLMRDSLGGVILSALPLSIGLCLLAYGLPGLQEIRPGHVPGYIPVSGRHGPIRLGLTLRAEPFEWK
ncbi:MAG TPA: hypothetical protein VK661_01760 [Planctomycetota bacterium]|nr:hypothetical protein [Planctomycetota bacterium]